jgi:hypothetical protein
MIELVAENRGGIGRLVGAARRLPSWGTIQIADQPQDSVKAMRVKSDASRQGTSRCPGAGISTAKREHRGHRTD